MLSRHSGCSAPPPAPFNGTTHVQTYLKSSKKGKSGAIPRLNQLSHLAAVAECPEEAISADLRAKYAKPLFRDVALFATPKFPQKGMNVRRQSTGCCTPCNSRSHCWQRGLLVRQGLQRPFNVQDAERQRGPGCIPDL